MTRLRFILTLVLSSLATILGIRKNPFPVTLVRGGMAWTRDGEVKPAYNSSGKFAFYRSEQYACAGMFEDGILLAYDYSANTWKEIA